MELATVSRGNAQFLARAQQLLGELAVVGGVVTIDESIVATLEYKAGNVHSCNVWSDPKSNGGLVPAWVMMEGSTDFWWGREMAGQNLRAPGWPKGGL